MKVVKDLALIFGIGGMLLLFAGCGTVKKTQTSSYGSVVVMPVAPYTVSTTTTYKTRMYKKKNCVGQTYYYQNYCPQNWRMYGYRSCYPKRYYCW